MPFDLEELIAQLAKTMDKSVAEIRREFEDDLYRGLGRPELSQNQSPQGSGMPLPRPAMGNIAQKGVLGKLQRGMHDLMFPNEGPGAELPVRSQGQLPDFDELSPQGFTDDFMSGGNRGQLGQRVGEALSQEGDIQGAMARRMTGGPAVSPEDAARAGVLGEYKYPVNSPDDMIANMRGLVDDVGNVGMTGADDVFNAVANPGAFGRGALGKFAGAQGPVDELIGAGMSKLTGVLPQGAQKAIGGAFSKVAPVLGPMAAAGNAVNIVGLTQMAGAPASPSWRMPEQHALEEQYRQAGFKGNKKLYRPQRGLAAESMRLSGQARAYWSSRNAKSASSADRAMLNTVRRKSTRKQTPLLRRSKVAQRAGSGFRK